MNLIVGEQLAYTFAFRYFLNGMLFVCLAFLFGGLTRIIWSISLVGAIVFFSTALGWARLSDSWMHDDMVTQWERVAKLEQELFGRIDPRTQQILADALKEQSSVKSEPASPDNPAKSD